MIKIEGLTKVLKNAKFLKNKHVQPRFEFCGGLVVVLSKACNLIAEFKLRIFDL